MSLAVAEFVIGSNHWGSQASRSHVYIGSGQKNMLQADESKTVYVARLPGADERNFLTFKQQGKLLVTPIELGTLMWVSMVDLDPTEIKFELNGRVFRDGHEYTGQKQISLVEGSVFISLLNNL